MDAKLLSLVEGCADDTCYFEQRCRDSNRTQLENDASELEAYRQQAANFYHRVRSIFFLEAIHRYFLPRHYPTDGAGFVPFEGHKHCLDRRFEEAIAIFLAHQRQHGTNDALSSALAAAYHGLAFKTLALQVQKTVRRVQGNQWMFRMGHPYDYPLKLHPELLKPDSDGLMPVLSEETSVRLDLSHAAWSDIFFLGMDYPEGARVLNLSVNLGIRGRDTSPRPPVCGFLRVIEQPVIRLTSVDLGASSELGSIEEVFDFAKDYLGLLKAAIIAAGIVPPGLEGSGQSLEDLLARLVGPGKGLELVSQVRDIPKGSRLAVSTNLLGCLIALCMRATGQVAALSGPLTEAERRTIASRAILGEWLGGSGGGWQDSGGVWPGIKLIEGELAREGDTEYGTSRGRLLPRHTLLGPESVSIATRKALGDSLVLVHGGMSQNVGPILEMVTEKYLLKLEREWKARIEAQKILREICGALCAGDVAKVGELTTKNFFGPIQTIIPWASNAYTERLIREIQTALGSAYRGFVMLGGMSGGGMGFWVDPSRRDEAADTILAIMRRTKKALEHALPFAMEPVVYDFDLNEKGSYATLLQGSEALLSPEYYLFVLPRWLRQDPRLLSRATRMEIERFSARQLFDPQHPLAASLVTRIFPAPGSSRQSKQETLSDLLACNGFDPVQHERIREDLRSGRIGLAQNRLSANVTIEDVRHGDVVRADVSDSAAIELGRRALSEGRVAVVTLAAGAGSRWTQGAGTVKALHPFARLSGKHRSFIETHLAKSRASMERYGGKVAHVFTTSHLTHGATEAFLNENQNFAYSGEVILSPGRSIGLRMVPMARDLRFAFEEIPHQRLDPQKEKVRLSLHKALVEWGISAGEAADYTDNLPQQCLHPVGHWYEIANLLLNGRLKVMLEANPALDHLLLHNIDTLGANLDPLLLGRHIQGGSALSVEVIRRRLEDRGGGLARAGGQLRLIEGLALAREEDEFKLSYYNTATSWIQIDALLGLFELTRKSLGDADAVAAGVRVLAAKMPTYVTLKDVKKRWGNGQEDIFPVAQFEKLWGDMTILPNVTVSYFSVPRLRGQQLKDQAQLDSWLRDGSAAYIESLCAFA